MSNNILFYFRYPFSPSAGGVERVSCVLGQWLSSHGYSVYFLSDIFSENKESIFVHNETGLDDDDNFDSLIHFIEDKSINIIINQGAFFPTTKRLYELRKYHVRIISVMHNSLSAMYSHPPLPFENLVVQSLFNNYIFTYIFKCYFYLKYHRFLKFVVTHSDTVVVLSECYIKEVERFACKSNNILSIGNPVTINIKQKKVNKENSICFLGRLTSQKRPDLLLRIWSKISNKSGWHLYIIGDGDMRPLLERIIEKKKLANVSLEGYQDPIPYLQKSKIMCMTSVYEGFPLALLEGMSFGVVPIAFNSFGSAKDIIKDGINGYLVPSFNEAVYVSRLSSLMCNDESRAEFSRNALLTANANTINHIGKQWHTLLTKTI